MNGKERLWALLIVIALVALATSVTLSSKPLYMLAVTVTTIAAVVAIIHEERK